MPPRVSDALVIGISSRALFDLRESHQVFEAQGLRAYARYQVDREDEFLQPGVAFPLARKLLALNEDGADHPPVEVILLSRNSADRSRTSVSAASVSNSTGAVSLDKVFHFIELGGLPVGIAMNDRVRVGTDPSRDIIEPKSEGSARFQIDDGITQEKTADVKLH